MIIEKIWEKILLIILYYLFEFSKYIIINYIIGKINIFTHSLSLRLEIKPN